MYRIIPVKVDARNRVHYNVPDNMWDRELFATIHHALELIIRAYNRPDCLPFAIRSILVVMKFTEVEFIYVIPANGRPTVDAWTYNHFARRMDLMFALTNDQFADMLFTYQQGGMSLDKSPPKSRM